MAHTNVPVPTGLFVVFVQRQSPAGQGNIPRFVVVATDIAHQVVVSVMRQRRVERFPYVLERSVFTYRVFNKRMVQIEIKLAVQHAVFHIACNKFR